MINVVVNVLATDDIGSCPGFSWETDRHHSGDVVAQEGDGEVVESRRGPNLVCVTGDRVAHIEVFNISGDLEEKSNG